MNRSSNVRKATARAEKIRVLIADDHTTFLAGLTSIIDMERDMIVVAQATDGHHAAKPCLWVGKSAQPLKRIDSATKHKIYERTP